MPCFQRDWPLEESFSRNRKELGGISRTISVEKSRPPLLLRRTQCVELGPHDTSPREIFRVRPEIRRSVRCLVLEIELMRKLVKNEILTIRRIARAMPNRIPRENQCPQVSSGVAQAV